MLIHSLLDILQYIHVFLVLVFQNHDLGILVYSLIRSLLDILQYIHVFLRHWARYWRNKVLSDWVLGTSQRERTLYGWGKLG